MYFLFACIAFVILAAAAAVFLRHNGGADEYEVFVTLIVCAVFASIWPITAIVLPICVLLAGIGWGMYKWINR